MGSGVAIWRRLCGAVSAMCDASQCSDARYETTWSFHGVASLRGTAADPLRSACNAFAGDGGHRARRNENCGEWGGEGDGRKSFIECGRTAFGVAKHNYLGNVAYYARYLSSILESDGSIRIILRGIEPGSVISCSGPRTCREEKVSDRAVLRLLTTPNRFRFKHDSYIKGWLLVGKRGFRTSLGSSWREVEDFNTTERNLFVPKVESRTDKIDLLSRSPGYTSVVIVGKTSLSSL